MVGAVAHRRCRLRAGGWLQIAGLVGCGMGGSAGASAPRLSRSGAASAQARDAEWRFVPEAVGVVAVLVTGRDHQRSKAQNGGEGMLDPLWRPRVIDASGEPVGDAEPALDLAQGQQAAVGRELPVVEADHERLARDR